MPQITKSPVPKEYSFLQGSVYHVFVYHVHGVNYVLLHYKLHTVITNIILTNHLYLSICSLGPVFALFVPFYCSIPRVQVTQVLGFFSITNKTLVYILGLQVWYVLACSSFSDLIAVSISECVILLLLVHGCV